MFGGGLVRAGVGSLRPNIKECLHSDWLRAGTAMEKVKLVFNSRNCPRGEFCHHSSAGFPRSIFQRYCATGKPAAREPQSATTPKAPRSGTGEHSWFCDGATVCLENLRLRHEHHIGKTHNKNNARTLTVSLITLIYRFYFSGITNDDASLQELANKNINGPAYLVLPLPPLIHSKLTFLLQLKGRNNHKVNPGGPRSFPLGPSRSDISQKTNNRLYRTSSWISDTNTPLWSRPFCPSADRWLWFTLQIPYYCCWRLFSEQNDLMQFY